MAKKAADVDIERAHPTRPGWFHGELIARAMNLTLRRVQQLAQEGVIPKGVEGYFPLLQSFSGYASHLQKQLAGRPPTSRSAESIDLMNERKRKIRMENDAIEGKLLEAADVSQLFEAACVQLSAAHDGVAGRIAGGDAILRHRLLNEHRQIRSDFADRLDAIVKLRRDHEHGGGSAPSAPTAAG